MNLDDVIKICCEYFDCDKATLANNSTYQDAFQRRALVMSAIYGLCQKVSYPIIGKHFKRDHTTVILACRRVYSDEQLIARLAHLVKYINMKAQVAA